MATSTLRSALRSRLTVALRGRDRAGAATLRSAIGALENAEAVPTSGDLASTTSSHVAGAALGLGAAEAERRVLTDADERAVVADEIEALRAAADEYTRVGAADRAAEARAAAQLLDDVLAGTKDQA
ncbi:hypothetical protein GCM10027053_35450 [Intrasporangium mesophilum]